MFLQHSGDAGLQVTAHQAFFSYVVPALVALIGPGLTGVAKMSLDSSRTRRSDKLTERITKLCNQIHALPEFTAEDCTGCSPRQALVAQMNVAIQELSELQKKKHARIRVASVTLAARVRSFFLLFRPHGFRAWLVHLLFWGYSAAYVLMIPLLAGPSTTPTVAGEPQLTPAWDAIFLVVAGALLSIPCFVLNLIANGIHRKQTDAAARASAGPTVVTTVTVQEGPTVSA